MAKAAARPYMTFTDELAQEIHERNIRYGFKVPNEPRDATTVTMLIVSELSEAFEELRKGYAPEYIYYSCGKPKDTTYHEVHPDVNGEIDFALSPSGPEVLFCDLHDRPVKPEGFGIEYADAMIRLLDAAPEFGINYDLLIPHKMAYNDTREPKHGKVM